MGDRGGHGHLLIMFSELKALWMARRDTRPGETEGSPPVQRSLSAQGKAWGTFTTDLSVPYGCEGPWSPVGFGVCGLLHLQRTWLHNSFL